MTNGTIESLGRIRVQALIILAVVFGIGILTGIAIDRERRPGPPEAPPPNRLPPDMRQALDLSPEQELRIEKILSENSERTRALMDRIMPQLQALKDSIRTEVRAELTPAQQEVFDRFEHGFADPPPDRPPRPGPPR